MILNAYEKILRQPQLLEKYKRNLKSPEIDRIFDLLTANKALIFLLLLLVSISLVIYRWYIFGGRLFLFEDFGSDSVRVSLPTYIYYFDWLMSGIPLWSDKMGIGTSILSHSEIIFDPFTYLLFIFGRNGIINMFVYLVIAKIVLSGIFLWLLVSKYKLSSYSKIIGALTYAFGGYMVIVGQNYVFSTAYVYLPLILLGFEIWLRDRNRLLLVIMLSATALYFSYFFYMISMFFILYALARYYMTYDFKLKHFLKYIFDLTICGLISLGLSAFFWLPSLTLILTNLRIGTLSPSIAQMLIPNISAVITAFARIFGPDTLGAPTAYLGYKHDYFQLAVYFGIITLVFFPQVFYSKIKKESRTYIYFFLILLAFVIFPVFAYLLNAFSDFTYRWVFVLHLSFALLLSISVNQIFNKEKLNVSALLITSIILFLISFLVSLSIKNLNLFQALLNLRIFFPGYLLIVCYVFLALLFFRTRYKLFVKTAILFLVCFELIWFSNHFIGDRLTTFPNPISNRTGYFDYTNEAVSYLKYIDKSIYRIDKSYDSVISEYGGTPSLNDSLVQGYKGLKGYNANNQPNYIRFLQSVGIFVKYPNLIPPPNASVHDVRYLDYHYISGVEDRYLLQTFLGVKYYLSRSPMGPPSSSYKYFKKIKDIYIYKNENFLPIGIGYEEFILDSQFSNLNTSQKELALLNYAVLEDKQVTKEEILMNIDIANNLDNINVSDLIKHRKLSYLEVTSYEGDHILGHINARSPGFLVITIPYDEGWELKLDNDKTEILKVDNGLIGARIGPGKHKIELSYFPPKMNLGIIISLFSVLIIIFSKRERLKKLFLKIYENSVVFLKKQIFLSQLLPTLKNLFKNGNNVFYAFSLFGIGLFMLGGLLTRGHTFYNFFNPDKGDYFMDFFNVLHSLSIGPYSNHFVYPPLPLAVYRVLLHFVPFDIVKAGSHAIRASQPGEIVFLFYSILTITSFALLVWQVKKGKGVEKFFFTLIIIFSAPFLFQFERANIIFVALLFLMFFVFFKDSKNRIVREIALISLAISSGIKLYPAIFGILLLKEKKYKEALRSLLYGLLFFVVPFFAVGGIGKIKIFFQNISFASNEALKWGLGYAVNLQNTSRIIGGAFGDFSLNPVLIGNKLSLILLVIGILAAYVSRSKWQTVAILTALMILVPAISYEYVLIFMIIPLILFLDTNKKTTKINFFYLFCFLIILVPINVGKVSFINSGFGYSRLPLTYGVLIQSFGVLMLSVVLIKNSFQARSIKKVLKAFVRIIMLIYGSKHKGWKKFLSVSIKIIVTFIIFMFFFGYDLFYTIDSSFFRRSEIPVSIEKEIEFRSIPYITRVEPYYVHYGDKIILNGRNFILSPKKHVKLMSSYGELDDEVVSWSDNQFVAVVPLHWKSGKVKIWLERPPIKSDKMIRLSNYTEIEVLDRLGRFGKDDVKYFAQLKYMSPIAKSLNNFRSYKPSNFKLARFIPTSFFQYYADLIQIKEKFFSNSK